MTGAPETLYVLARRALIDALEALGEQIRAMTVVGAQAIYLHTGPAAFTTAEYTKDADLAVDPSLLLERPLLTDQLRAAGFEPGSQPGIWERTYGWDAEAATIPVDLLVPGSLGGSGRRGARLGPHGNRTARKVKGIEGALVDRELMRIEALEQDDARSVEVMVAGPAALLVAKVHKIAERVEDGNRVVHKDALDLYRLMLQVPTPEIASGLRRLLEHATSAAVTSEAVELFDQLFTTEDAPGSEMVRTSTASIAVAETTVRSSTILSKELLRELGR